MSDVTGRRECPSCGVTSTQRVTHRFTGGIVVETRRCNACESEYEAVYELYEKNLTYEP